MLALGGRREPAAHRPAIEPPLQSGCPGHTASPSSPPAPGQEDAVCCMCGDRGLPEQLFRCKSCRVRTQHSYCSELYPRATAYRRCNWCLREPPAQQGGAGAASHAAAVAANGNNNNNNKPAAAEAKRKASMTTATASDEDRHRQQRRHEGCSRRTPPVLGHPVKKKRVSKAGDDERARAAPGDAVVKAVSCDANAAAGERKELMRSGKPRVKVRRYKLLAEVISC